MFLGGKKRLIRLNANGTILSYLPIQPLFFETYNLAFTFATLDLKMNWRQYKESLEKELTT
jgi:hypothetical protein